MSSHDEPNPKDTEPGSALGSFDADSMTRRIDTLITRGVERCRDGDLRGAMADWEHALALEPDEERAREYLDYATKLEASRAGHGEAPSVPFGLQPPARQSEDQVELVELDLGWESRPSAQGGETPRLPPPPESEATPDLADELGAVAEGLLEVGGSDFLDLEPPGTLFHQGAEPAQPELDSEDPMDAAPTIDLRGKIPTHEDEDDEDDEITVPGSEPAPPLQTSLPLSQDAIAVLRESGHGLATDESTAERSGARGLFLDNLDELSGAPPDDRVHSHEPAHRVTFRPETEPEPETETDDDEATRERRPSDRLLAPQVSLAPGESLLLDDTTAKRRVPEPAAPTSEFERDVETRDLKRQPISSPALRAPDLDAEHVPINAVVVQGLLAEIDRGAPEGESDLERVRRRVGSLIERAEIENDQGHAEIAVTCLDLALDEDPASAAAQKLIHRHLGLILEIYRSYIGDLSAVPSLALPMHELPKEQLDNRAAFLLSRIDGNLSFEQVLDIAGMSELEAFRYLCKMLVKGILELR